jgi:ectoine hydroxylase-related dioxygenase (phytanoyl-CoA dioxygenase family)
MLKRYSDDEIEAMAAFYEEHGVVKLPGLIEPEWTAKILDVINDISQRADTPPPPGADFSFGKADGRMTIRYMWRGIPLIRDFMLNQDLAEPVARITRTRQLRFWFDLTFIHEGGQQNNMGAGTPWHHDVAAFTFKGMQLPSLWMALTPADAERSRLMFIDKSHKTAPGYYRTPDNIPPANGEKDGFLDVPDFDRLIAEGKEQVVTWDVLPGDAIMIHPYTVHGAKGNTGKDANSRRVAITTRWLGDDVRFIPTSYAKALKQVGIANSNIPMGGKPDGEYFPLVWDESSQSQAA